MPKRETTVKAFNQPGMARTRALVKAMGYDAEDLRRPRIGVANSWSETSPGHIHLRAVADAVKAGIWQAGGTPYEFGAPWTWDTEACATTLRPAMSSPPMWKPAPKSIVSTAWS